MPYCKSCGAYIVPQEKKIPAQGFGFIDELESETDIPYWCESCKSESDKNKTDLEVPVTYQTGERNGK